MSDEERVRVELDDVYHLLSDERIRREPERIERLLLGVFEIRQARGYRRRALSHWDEDGRPIFGFAIIEPDGRLRTMHVMTEKSLEPYRRREVLPWPTP